MKPVRLAVTTLVVAIALLLAALVLIPGSIVGPIANYLLSGYSAEIRAFDQLRLGWRSSSVAALRLQLPGVDVVVDNLTVTYQPWILLAQGRVASVTVNRLEVLTQAGTGPTDPPASSLPPLTDLLALAEALPFAQLAVSDYSVAREFNASGGLTVTTRPLQVAVELETNLWPDWHGALRLQQNSASQLTGTASLLHQQQPVVAADWSLDLANNPAFLSATSEINLQAAQDLPVVARLMGGQRLLDESLQISSELHLPVAIADGPITVTGIQLNTDDGALSWATTELAGSVGAELRLPLSLTGSWDRLASQWRLNLDAAQASLGVDTELGAGNIDVLLEDIEVRAADNIRVSLRAATQAMDLDLPGVELHYPAISSELELVANQLRGTAHLSLNERLGTSLSFRHDLDAQAGDLEFTIEPVRFSDANPLSGLVRVQGLDADIVAGSMSGSGELAWQQSAPGWQLSGPMSLNLEQLSGFVGEVVVVGFNSALQARLEDGNLRSPGLLPASIATLDVGLPMNRIDWQYGFDLQAGTLTISGLRTGMLGGTLEVPDFVFDSSAAENRLRVVLSRLDLAAIVALANYPNLQVNGTISGYLPLLITREGVSLEEGLVSALNPGGSIRYTPAAGASNNASVQLLNEALSNYLFETLNAELEYGADGDLDMAVQLQGSNPDMRGGQPINLNVTIADNIPTLLRSLQAGRVITERLEQRLNSQ